MLIFHCPACGTRLQLPIAMAGVSGPCPRCAIQIQSPAVPAPRPAAPQPVAAAHPPAAPAAAVPIAPRMPAQPTKPRPAPRSEPATSPPPGTPVVIQPRERARPAPVARDRLFNPSHTAAVVPGSGMRKDPHHRPHHARRSRILSWGIPGLFIVACLVLFGGVLLILRPKPTVENPTERAPSSLGKSSNAGLWPIQIESKAPHDPGRAAGSDTPAAETAGDPHGGTAPPDLATRATSVVQDFLEATTLEERLPLMISRRSTEEIAMTSLAGKLPNHQVPELERQITIPRELLTEFYYTATFPEATAPNPKVIAILVRQRGDDDPPKVLADPFIDLFDGSIQQFSAQPLDGARTFHVLAEPIPICSDLAVPEPDQRITMRLRPHEHGEELANAYTRKASQIGEMLNQPRSTLRWGQAHPCVVTIQWNRDAPEHPFLELIRLDALTWNH